MQLAHLRCALSHLVFLRPLRYARQVAIDDKDAHAALARSRVGTREHEGEVGDGRVMNPQFRAAEFPAVGGARGRGADAGNVRSRVGFGNAVGRTQLGAQQRLQVLRTLRVAAMRAQQRADEFEQAALIRHRRIAARQLFHHERVSRDIHSRAAELLRHGDAEESQFAHLLVDLRWKTLFAIQFLGQRPDDFLRKPPRRVANLLVRFRESHVVSMPIVRSDICGRTCVEGLPAASRNTA